VLLYWHIKLNKYGFFYHKKGGLEHVKKTSYFSMSRRCGNFPALLKLCKKRGASGSRVDAGKNRNCG
jgi:hypothetical protein